MMSDREVWLKACDVLAEHGAMTADYIIDQLSDALDNRVEVEDWRRIAASPHRRIAASPHRRIAAAVDRIKTVTFETRH